MRSLLRYLELVLTGAGVLVVAAVFFLFRDVEPWKAAALSALVVGVVHGIIFFSVRAAQRRARNEAIVQVRKHLDDLIRNKLQVVLCATEMPEQDWRPVAHYAVLEIEGILARIEREALSATAH